MLMHVPYERSPSEPHATDEQHGHHRKTHHWSIGIGGRPSDRKTNQHHTDDRADHPNRPAGHSLRCHLPQAADRECKTDQGHNKESNIVEGEDHQCRDQGQSQAERTQRQTRVRASRLPEGECPHPSVTSASIASLANAGTGVLRQR